MEHLFVFEPSLSTFTVELKRLIEKGYKQVIGSVYTKSIKTNMSATHSDLLDVGGAYSISVEDDQGNYVVVTKGDPDDFYMAVSELLDKGYKVITGSLYINTVKLHGYIKVSRCYTTWYSCTMYK